MLCAFLLNVCALPQVVYHFLSAETNCNINFNDIGLALFSISILFPIFDKLTERTIGEFRDLKDKTAKEIKNKDDAYDILASKINARIEKLRNRRALKEFRNVIAISLGFISLSITYNAYPWGVFLVSNIIGLIVLTVILFCKISKRINDRNKAIELIDKSYAILDDPTQGLPDIL